MRSEENFKSLELFLFSNTDHLRGECGPTTIRERVPLMPRHTIAVNFMNLYALPCKDPRQTISQPCSKSGLVQEGTREFAVLSLSASQRESNHSFNQVKYICLGKSRS